MWEEDTLEIFSMRGNCLIILLTQLDRVFNNIYLVAFAMFWIDLKEVRYQSLTYINSSL